MELKTRVMGLDVGDSRVGIAFSDPTRTIAQPHSTIDQEGRRSIAAIVALAREMNCGTIVIGLPFELDGAVGPQAEKVQRFGAKLSAALKKDKKTAEIEVAYFDERLTSVQAERVIAGSKVKDRERRAIVDRVAAALILEAYLGASSR